MAVAAAADSADDSGDDTGDDALAMWADTVPNVGNSFTRNTVGRDLIVGDIHGAGRGLPEEARAEIEMIPRPFVLQHHEFLTEG